jgi:hypothetical protein
MPDPYPKRSRRLPPQSQGPPQQPPPQRREAHFFQDDKGVGDTRPSIPQPSFAAPEDSTDVQILDLNILPPRPAKGEGTRNAAPAPDVDSFSSSTDDSTTIPFTLLDLHNLPPVPRFDTIPDAVAHDGREKGGGKFPTHSLSNKRAVPYYH